MLSLLRLVARNLWFRYSDWKHRDVLDGEVLMKRLVDGPK